MSLKKTNLLQDIYLEHLKIINGVNLTRREVDLIAFFICGRSTKKIASFFQIAPKTVENHTHNIMLKFGCNSREGIIDFVEKSDKLPILRKYYTTLLAQIEFDRCLKTISVLSEKKKPSCYILCDQEQNFFNSFIAYIEKDLKLSGVHVDLKSRESLQNIQEAYQDSYLISFEPEDSKDLLLKETKRNLRLLCYRPGVKTPVELSKEFESHDLLDLRDQRDYYVLIFEILKILIPSFNIEQMIAGFEKEFHLIEGFLETKTHQQSLKENEFNESVNEKITSFFQVKAWKLVTMILLIAIFGIGIYDYNKIERGTETRLGQRENSIQNDQKISGIISDLENPKESNLLDRSNLITEMREKFRDKQGIQTVALVGIGGAGKTTLAQQYVHSQNSSVAGNINAETRETILKSFQHLAKALAQTEADKKVVLEINEVKNPEEREDKLLRFVQERLKSYPHWILIYDNVEKFIDIQRYFPNDSEKWGQGKIILTTQDSNIGNNKNVDSTVLIRELSPDEKLNLFIKIMTKGGEIPFTYEQTEEAKRFLVEIPPFPLDVSLAAYYLKTTNISYNDYLKHMLKYNKDFSSVQEHILQAAGGYAKTRYGIVTISLERILDKKDDYKDLLLFISLLDSQNIPRDLLTKFKKDSVVDKFLCNLKQYSLIQNENTLDSLVSIHRNTQSIILAYLTNNLKLLQNQNLTQPLATVLESYMSDAVDKEDFSRMKILCRHAERFLTHDNLLNETVKSTIRGELGCIYYYLCDYVKAKRLLEQSVSDLSKSKNDEKLARFMVFLGNVNRRLGQEDQAIKLLEQGLLIYKKTPEPSVGMARASGYLGAVYMRLGEFQKAKALFEESLKIHKKYSTHSIGFAWSLANLGKVYSNFGDNEKAKELFEHSLAIYKTFSENYVGAAWVCVDLGMVYMQLGDFKMAKDFLEESLKIYNSHFSENHVYVARAFVQLGNFYREQGEYDKAERFLKKSLLSFEETYGKNHIETAAPMKNLGTLYLLKRNLEEAESFMMKALAIFQKKKHPEQYMVLEDLADLSLKKSDKSQAFIYLSKALEGIQVHFSENSPHIERIQSKLDQVKD